MCVYSSAAVTVRMQASAAVGVVAGNLADWLQKARGWRAVHVRALTQTLATLGRSPPRARIACPWKRKVYVKGCVGAARGKCKPAAPLLWSVERGSCCEAFTPQC